MKYLLILVSMLLTACATTMPPLSEEECAAQRQYILKRDAQLSERKKVVESRLNKAMPFGVWQLIDPRTSSTTEFNKLVDKLEAQVTKHNLQCVRKS